MHSIGIDLGTTYSAVAVFTDGGVPKILQNREGEDITPSVVMFPPSQSGDEPIVGTMAKHSAAGSPGAVVQYVKRNIGDSAWRFDSPNGGGYSAEEISAMILRRLKEDAELALGFPVKDVVITVPAYFDDVRRTATKQAGAIAGLNVLRVLNEPTAAALAYGLDTSDVNETVIVYDLGGGTFDATLLKINGGSIDVLGTDGDRNLGGLDFDNRIMEFVGERIFNESSVDVLDDLTTLAQVREKAEIAKRSLTTVASAAIHLNSAGGQHKVQISRDEFERITSDLMRRTEEIVESLLRDAGLSWNQIDKVILVGGSTRMPMVPSLLERLSGKKVSKSVDPDKAVALGAAIQAAIEAANGHGSESFGGSSDLVPFSLKDLPTISDVCSQSLGVIVNDPDTGKQFNNVVLARNSKIPSKASDVVHTSAEMQTSVKVEVTEGEGEQIDYVTVIGERTLSIPPYPKGAPLRISYAYDIDQTIQVEVEDLTANVSLGVFEIDRSGNLSPHQISQSQKRIGEISVG